MSFYPPPKQQPSTSFVSFISRFFSVNSITWTEIVLLNTRTFSSHQRLAQKVPTIWLETKNNMLWTHSDIVSYYPVPTCPSCIWGWMQFPASVWGCMSPVLPSRAPRSPSLSASQPPFQPALLESQTDEPWGLPSQIWNTPASVVFSLLFSPNQHKKSVLAWGGRRSAQAPSQTSSEGYPDVISTFTRQTGLQETTWD